tara:strand:- start:325 stop:639 length:315 start_codon:yes stop_codon:yes gene_type:complete
MTNTQFLKDNRQTVIDYYTDNVKGLYDTTLNAFMIDLMNNFRKITTVENLTRTDLFGNLLEAKNRLGLMSVQIEVSYLKPYRKSNHAKQAKYYGKDKANQIANS